MRSNIYIYIYYIYICLASERAKHKPLWLVARRRPVLVYPGSLFRQAHSGAYLPKEAKETNVVVAMKMRIKLRA
jgi:hypothetical protein